MPTKPDLAEHLSPGVERLAELAQSELGHLSPEQRAVGMRAVHERLTARAKPFHLGPRFALACAAVVALVAFAAGRYALWDPSQLSYVVDGKPVPVAELVSAQAQPKVVRFSEGSELRVLPGARARVRSADQNGAQLLLETGKVALEVTPRAHADWTLSAGPYLIRVTGTRFTTEWQPSERELLVRLEHGSVNVSGPLADDVIRLRAGQQLRIRLQEREVVIRDLNETWERPSEAPAVPPPTTPPVEAPPTASPEPSASAAPTNWAAALAAGKFDDILQSAKARGVDQVLKSTSSEELAALADAARFRQQHGLARRALMAQRERFAGSSRAKDAAFLLGRLEEASGASGQAIKWYERYLAEAPSGTYASEALGRMMLAMQTTAGDERARPLALEYLRRFPGGTYARTAKSIGQPP